MRLLHDPPKISALFDDPNLVSRAGLVPLMGLAERGGLGALAGGAVGIIGATGLARLGGVAEAPACRLCECCFLFLPQLAVIT